MSFVFELVTGSDLTLDRQNLTITRKFRGRGTLPAAVGGDFFDFISSTAIATIKQTYPTYSTPQGTLFWNSIQIHENWYAQSYDISVTYGPHDHQSGAYQVSVDQTGGTVHVTAGTRIAGYGPIANAVNNGGLIGVEGDDVKGVDIPVEQTKINVMFRHPGGVLNRTYIRNIGKLVGFPNSGAFLGYEAGEVVYIGGVLTETETEASASYSFAVSYNRTNFSVGGINILSKKGWDVISPIYEDNEDNGRGVKKLLYIEIIRPAGREWKSYSAFGWGT